MEEEVESTWQDVIGALEEALGTTEDVAAPEAASSAADVTRWRTPLFESYQVPISPLGMSSLPSANSHQLPCHCSQ